MSTISAGTTTTTGYVVTSDTTGALVLKTGASGTTAVTVDTSQNVGIGTTSPIGVANYQGITIGGTTGGLIRFQSGASTQNAQIAANTSGLEIECVNTGIPIKFYTGGSLRATLDSSGSLGLGTASPAYRLQVAGTASQVVEFTSNATATAVRIDNTNASGWGGNLAFYSNGTGAGFVGTIGSLIGSTAQDITMWATSGNGVRFYTNGNNERMRVTSAGNVGIGTTSPSSILTLSQAQAPITTFWGSARADGNPYTAGGIESTFVTRDGVPALGAFIRILDVNTFGAFPTTIRGGAITFGTVDGLSGQGVNATERARIDSSGNVGIGTTSPNAKLQIDSGDIRLQGSAPGKLLFFSTGNGVSQNATFEVQNDGATTNTGEFRFSTRNQAGTLAERMRLGAEGKLCINRTSTINGAWLAIQAENNQTAIGTIWADNTYMIQQRFSDSYFMGIGGDANGRNLRLVANSADATAKITFWTSGNGTPTERARFTSAGDFDLYITPAKDGQLRWTSGGGGAVQAFIYANGNPELIAQTGGSGGVKLTSGATSWVSASDIRNKNIIEPITNAVAKIATLSSVIYSFKDDEENTRRAGLVAQELLEVLPEAVYVPAKEDELLGVRYSEVTPLLVAAIKEQQAIIESLTQRIAALEGQ